MNPERIIIIRHGQDKDNEKGILNGQRDEPLTELGKQQARESARRLTGENIKAIYSSPLQRTRSTAQIIAGEIGLENIIIHEGLIERNLGSLTGVRLDEQLPYAKEHNTSTLKTPDGGIFVVDVEGGEHLQTLYNRAKSTYEDIKKRHQSNETVLLVTHGGIGKMIYGVHNNLNWEESVQAIAFNNATFTILTFKQ